MRKPLSLRACVATATIANLAFLVACGDTVENVYQTGSEVVSSVGDLPECNSKNDGEIAWVKGEPSVRICSEGEWYATMSDESGFSCKTEELKDGSGLKIICNGDSIGVVLNGENGKDGKSGKDGKAGSGCSMKDKTDSTITVVCGDSTMVVELGSGSDELELDSERVAVSLDSLAGFSQKGPFLKGSTVYLYELSDGRTLKQTNGNFTSYITRDDGRYKFTARDLASQYAMIVVEGNYRNEVTGNPSDAPIRLRALTDMRRRSDANINLLTHLEFDRVYYLVTREKKTVKQAKKQAQAEIFKAFDIDTTGFEGSAEDLDVFGATDADAALLAISILLQGDGNETELSVLLTEIANDMETDGTWDDSTAKTRLADWVALADGKGRLANFRSNVGGWQLSDTVPEFEKFVRNFYSGENNLGKCGSKDIPVGTVKEVGNARSKYYAATYSDTSKSKIRFICVDNARWRVAIDIEKDTSGFAHDAKVGDVKHGAVNAELMYVYQDGNWRHGTDLDSVLGKGCLPSLNNSVEKASDGEWYTCRGNRTRQYVNDDGEEESSGMGYWDGATDIEKDTNGLGNNFNEGDTALGLITNRVYAFEEGYWIYGSSMDSLVGKGCVKGLKDSIALASDGVWYRCDVKRVTGDIYMRNWLVAPQITIDTMGWGNAAPAGGWKNGDVRNGKVNTNATYVYQDGIWRLGTALDSILVGLGGTACIFDDDTSTVKYKDVYYVCTHQAWGDTLRKWTVAPDIYNDTKDMREECKEDGEYSYGNIVAGLVNTQKNYVCDNDRFREATFTDEYNGRSCVSYIYDHIYRLKGILQKCTSTGWTSVANGDTTGIMKDKGHRVYKTVVIGDQLWMKENLNYETDDSRCYSRKADNCIKYGRLYTWADAMTVCPADWHLPRNEDWNKLISAAETKNNGKSGITLMSKKDWPSNSGKDDLGFSALPAGMEYDNEAYDQLLYGAYFWSSTEYGDRVNAYSTSINIRLDSYNDKMLVLQGDKTFQISVRCILD